MNAISTSEDVKPPSEPLVEPPDVDEVPITEEDAFADVPVPKRVTREIDNKEDLSSKEDLRHGDEGIDDPPETQEQLRN